MKVFTTGNVLNNSYNMTRFLRAKGIDAEMFLDDFKFARCDVALVTSWGLILSQAARVPHVFYSYGGDLMAAHTSREIKEGLRRLMAKKRPGIRPTLLGLRQRLALWESTDAVAPVTHPVQEFGRLVRGGRRRLTRWWDNRRYRLSAERVAKREVRRS